MTINSRRKGKAGELEAVNLLKEMGFDDARRSVQFCGRAGDADIACPESLPNVHIEVKRRKDIRVGNAAHTAAIVQSRSECGDREWCVLWREDGAKIWKLTFCPMYPEAIATVSGLDVMAECLKWLNSGRSV